MSVSYRASLLAGAFAATLLLLLGSQGTTQKAVTQPVREEPTYEDRSGKAFAPVGVVVVLEQPASPADLRELNRENGARVEEDLPRSDVNVVDLPRDLSVSEALQAHEESPGVAYAEPNFSLRPAAAPNDPNNSLWGLNNTGQTGSTPDADIDAPEVWDTATGSPDTVVGVIDEGIDVNPPDLRDNIWSNSGEVAGSKLDDDGNGYDPDLISGNGDEHGTHVAGTIAAVGNNGVGIAGVN